MWRPEEWPGQPLTLQIVGNRHVPRAVSPGNRFTPLLQLQRLEPGSDDSHARRCRAARQAAKHARPESRAGAERPDAGPVRDSAGRSQGRLLCHFEGPGGRLLHAADAGARAPRRAPAPHSRHARGHQLPRQPRERAARFAHHEPAHARRAREPGTNPNGTQGDNTFLRVLPQGRLGDPPARRRRMHAARSSRTSASARPTTSSRSATSWGRSRPARPAQPHPPGTHWYHPHCAWRDPRSGRQRPRRLLHHRRGCRRCDQPRDDRERRGRIRREDRTVRLPRALMMIQRVEVSRSIWTPVPAATRAALPRRSRSTADSRRR